jgi:hypothetical protein
LCTFDFAPLDDGCTRLDARVQPTGPLSKRVLFRVLGPALGRKFRNDLDQLAQLLRSDDESPAGP